MSGFLQVFYSIFSSILTALAIPNEIYKFGSSFYGMIALIPLFIAIHNSKSFNEAGLVTGLQIFVTHLLSSYWLGKFKDFAIFTLGASALAYFAFGFVFGNYIYAVFYYTEKSVGRKNGTPRSLEASSSSPLCQILGFASIWTIYEWFKSTGWLAYPWGTLFMSAYRWHTLKQICSITGTLGITYLFALFSATLAEFIILSGKLPFQLLNFEVKKTDEEAIFFGKIHFIRPHLKNYKCSTYTDILFSYRLTAIYCVTLFVISCTFGVYQYKIQPQVNKTLNVTIVQHNNSGNDPFYGSSNKNIRNSMIETDKGLKEFKNKNEKCDLVLWNESTLSNGGWFPEALENSYKHFPFASPTDKKMVKPFATYIEELGVPLLAGGPAHYENEDNALNAAILFGIDGKIVDFYGKSHLVPFAEEIPYGDTEFVQKTMEKLVGFSNGWTAGKKYVLFEIENSSGEKINFTTPVCFEDAFPDLCRNLYNMGSELFVNITNDSWSETSSSEYQHFVIASYRAIEHRTSMVRSCTSGYSVVINCNGDAIDDLPLFETTHKNVKVPIYKRSNTFYSKYGTWIMAPIFVFIVLFFIIKFLENIKEEHRLQKNIQKFYKQDSETEEDF